MQKQGALGLFGLGANVVATQNDLVMSNGVLDGLVSLTASLGSILMDDEDSVIRTTDEGTGQVDLVAATGIGATGAATRLDTGHFNAETPVGDVNLHLHREARAERVHALTGSAHLVGDGDGVLGTTDLDLADVRIARDLELRAESIRGQVTQTVQATPLRLWATNLQGGVADRIDLGITAAPYVLNEQLAARVADIRSNATRFNIVNGHIGEELKLTTGYVSALMDNTTRRCATPATSSTTSPGRASRWTWRPVAPPAPARPCGSTRPVACSPATWSPAATPPSTWPARTSAPTCARPAGGDARLSAAYPVRPALQRANAISTAPGGQPRYPEQ